MTPLTSPSYALFFAPRGAKIVINDVNAANAEKVVGEVKAREYALWWW